MSLSLQEGVDVAFLGREREEGPALASMREAAPYEPDVAAYLPDPRNDRLAILERQVNEQRVTLGASFACGDGRREFLDFDAAQAAAYLGADVAERERIVNRRIMERRLTVAERAARRLAERGVPDFGRELSPEEDACLREFGGLVPELRLRESGEAYQIDVLRAGFGDRAHRALASLREGNVKAAHLTLRESDPLREDGFFDGGEFEEPSGLYRPWNDREFLMRGSPAFRQQLISDVWDTLAKCYFAWTHDPVIREGVAILTEFPLGRGIRVVAKDKKLQHFIDDFMKRNKMRRRIRRWAMELSRDGEIFVRLMRQGDGTLDVLRLPPETIWEIVTDGENVERVFYYVQRYPTRYQLDAANVPAAQVRYIERTITATDVIHIKINADDDDVRGRSDIFPALGWAKRLRDYWDAEVQKAQGQAAYQWIIQYEGGPADGQRLLAQVPGSQPVPGSSWVVNKKVDVKGVPSGTSASGTAGQGSTYEGLLNHVALAFGVPKDYFGVSSRGSRATALVASEPAAKRFEDRQDILDDLVSQVVDAAIAEARAYGLLDDVADFSYRNVFPAIIKADASTRADLLRNAKAEGAISHKTMAEEMVGEIDLEGYDYAGEMAQIESEIGVPGYKISAKDTESVKRGLPEPSDVAFDPGEVPNPAPQTGDVGGAVDDGDEADDPHDDETDPEDHPGSTTASPSSAKGGAAIRKQLGAHERREARRPLTARQVREAAAIVSAAGGVVILP